jgi:hypothetical protein
VSESESIVCPNCTERSPAGYILCPYCGFDLTKIVQRIQRVRITFRERFVRIWRSLYDPRQSRNVFREIGVNPDRTGALFVLFLLSVAYATRLGALVIKASTSSYHDAHFWYFLISPWFVGIGFFVIAIFGWFTSGIITWLAAKTLGGKAGLRDTLGILGYSLSPLIVGSLLINVLIVFLGPNLSTITLNSWTNYALFEILYLPFLALAAYHCGNGIHTAHLLNYTYSYGISGVLTASYAFLYLLPVII